jgi:hypothetical protein
MKMMSQQRKQQNFGIPRRRVPAKFWYIGECCDIDIDLLNVSMLIC